ncbi:uncharacterized protein DUF3558 [Halopolyspora algeriensis]|uniref:Uncharacterized protein DUF3558 n=1 Tax=Halopolyspora algeriensis TaxID=1500506 RepID=A0A368VIT5_9ACTN|nr:DUF3558 domain-containing protein [Halopolyspora algeriensis]RCW40279.1 uncharacterized protein DUF3558 [Halopolyspora algeriensis]TQM46240.1 uncharacterized protein DUF3558 [Halopolyspora algeriensis]
MRKPTRAAVAAASAVLLGTLTACSGGSQAQPENRPTTTGPTPQAPSGVSITDPKDAAAVPLCDLLPSEAAKSLGFKDQGKKNEAILSDGPPFCVWKDPQGSGTKVMVSVLKRKIADYYASPDTWSDFRKITVASHPAVRANKGNPVNTGYCDVYLATQKSQILLSQVSVPASERPATKPCQLSRKVLEAVVPTLPPAQ